MQYMKNSRPVSGAEHLWSHIWEMEDLSFNGEPVTHGHKVTIGTLAATAFTEIFFADPNGPPMPEKTYRRPGREERREEVSAAFSGSRARGKIIEASMEKFMDEKKADYINQAFRDSWKEIRDQVLEKLLPYGELRGLLSGALCPLKGEEIGLSRAEVIATARRAHMMRNKYCVLDIAWDMGVFEQILKKMEESETYLV
jgi:glycerol-1-phosphate dehydrogenase [NAD(P)+]